MARLGGKARLALTLDEGGLDRDVWAELTRYEITSEDGPGNFCDPYPGASDRSFFLEGEAVQKTDSDGLWRLCWSEAGTRYPVRIAPYGNETPTTDQPHFVGEITLAAPPTLGGEASRRAWAFEFRWPFTAQPELVTSG